MKRSDVYKIIDTEREYQNVLSSDRTDGSTKTVGDYITMLQHYQNELVKAWTINAGNEKALNIIRKIGGIAIYCMEDYGAPEREIELVWDSNKPNPYSYGTQTDWNQTLITKLNQAIKILVNLNEINDEFIQLSTFYVPIKFIPIFETLLYYRKMTPDTGKLTNNGCKVCFIDEESDFIKIGKIKIRIVK